MIHLVLIIVVAFLLSIYEPAGSIDAHAEATLAPMKVQGEVVDVGADRIVVQTPRAKFTLNKRTTRLNAHVGDKVTLWVTSGQAVIDHHRQDTGRRHRFVTGTLLDPASAEEVKLWTPDGHKVYSLAAHEAKTVRFPEGTMVTVEIDEAGTVVDVHSVETEQAACDTRHHCKVMLHGTVRKIEDRMIFIKTPVVEYEIPANVAPSVAAVGDEMTLWVYENSVVLNYHQAGESLSRRFVTGTLKYEDATKSHIRLWTPEGEQTFALPRIDKANHLREGQLITVEVSEAGTTLDLWQSS